MSTQSTAQGQTSAVLSWQLATASTATSDVASCASTCTSIAHAHTDDQSTQQLHGTQTPAGRTEDDLLMWTALETADHTTATRMLKSPEIVLNLQLFDMRDVEAATTGIFDGEPTFQNKCILGTVKYRILLPMDRMPQFADMINRFFTIPVWKDHITDVFNSNRQGREPLTIDFDKCTVLAWCLVTEYLLVCRLTCSE